MVPIPSFAVDGINDNLEVFAFIDVLPIPVTNVGNTTFDVELDVTITFVAIPDVDENPAKVAKVAIPDVDENPDMLMSKVPLNATFTVVIPDVPSPGPTTDNPVPKLIPVPSPTFIPLSKTSIVAPEIKMRSSESTNEMSSTTSPEYAGVINCTVVPIPIYSVVSINLTPFK